ncbi:polysaccharide deacetylase family protein [Chromobacterium sp. IIBBL 290-4]|uniref:polysaccharide deacetylase family protein n=1 Tax=Chromobacterium sp. IIBBL 290-4 TaxID=2953890 RepID=UPI0020B6CE4C|nr:polysaccharide deacetylase family protein [Chromobacterium sp. IIBBL 290-4]UTH74999.1 polysaccharide deacetylase family protein [Chromobacterium sp. IIBBL 290-4]
MKKTICQVLWLVAAVLPSSSFAITWPNSVKSAVSISADDGWPSQLSQVNILDRYGFRGTFYLTAQGMPPVVTNAASWQQAFQRGHEIGNHSYSHWGASVLVSKSWTDVASDVSNMEWWLLKNIYSMVPTDHTYAYPEGAYSIGSQDGVQSRQVGTCEYAALLSAVVSGARIAGTGENDPEVVMQRRYYIGGLPVHGDDVTAFNMAKQAIDNGIAHGTWTVLIFHSLGDTGDGYSVTAAAYEKIISYLYSRRSDLWVAPVVAVKNYISTNTISAGWTCAQP